MLHEADRDRWLVELGGDIAVLALTHQVNLDALGLDDRISTGRLDEPTGTDSLLALGQELADAVHDWWGGRPPALMYRSRTVPQARSLAFPLETPLQVRGAGRLRDATTLLAALVTRHGFEVPDAWLT